MYYSFSCNTAVRTQNNKDFSDVLKLNLYHSNEDLKQQTLQCCVIALPPTL